MKNIIILLVAIIALYSCNKPVTSYSTASPWSGISPMSAIINNKNFAGTFGYVYINDTTPVYVNATSVDLFGVDSSITKSFRIMLPRLGGALNTLKIADGVNKLYGITYSEVLKKGTTVIKDKNYYTFNAEKGCTLKLLEYDAILAKGIFSGYLRDVNGTNEYIYISNGFFNVNK
jgi:hypothetical protein